jgi:murein DD-endopeptidase MepM/ murein hydrolase activator NlpD
MGLAAHRRFLVLCGILSMAGCTVIGYAFYQRIDAARIYQHEALLAEQDAARMQARVVVFTEDKVKAGASLSESLEHLGLDASAATSVVGSAKAVYDLRRVRAGNRLGVGRSLRGEFRAVRYQVDGDRMLWVTPEERGGYHAEIKPIPSKIETVGITGRVRDSLFNAVTEAGESPELAIRIAEIFGWDLDFYTDPRVGDTFRVVVEKKTYRDSEPASYGRIIAAEYNNDGHAYRALLFHDGNGVPAYYAADGSALQKAFLRSPLKYGAPITSHFSHDRYHPILKEHRPHLGIDYGAPTGTPVQTIGSGRVIFAGPKAGAGNLVHIQHSNGYETMYMHLSRILVHNGQRVEQGDRIGLVGVTGLATGPHLDFRILQHGQYRNFETLHLPPADPVRKGDWLEFAAAREHAFALMPGAKSQLAQGASSDPLPASNSLAVISH